MTGSECLQEYFLHALSQPRPHASLDLMQQQQQGKDQLGNTMRRSQSYHGLDPLGIPSAVYGAIHDIHVSFIHAAPFGRRPKKQPSFATLPPSVRGSFRTSDGVTPPAVPCPAAGGTPAGGAAHPVLSMLAEQVSHCAQRPIAQVCCGNCSLSFSSMQMLNLLAKRCTCHERTWISVQDAKHLQVT